ncbi:MAG: cellulose biosynthesis cyclic di-GMP-binding regulatory protein BcsB [Rhizobiales bacterium]|nr:cellulose biosynthesis cyclic di-GMP-binding regulatory protein BcsB [Hyphomicrobiales bacterium]
MTLRHEILRAIVVGALLAPGIALAQAQVPFDMSLERGGSPAPAPAPAPGVPTETATPPPAAASPPAAPAEETPQTDFRSFNVRNTPQGNAPRDSGEPLDLTNRTPDTAGAAATEQPAAARRPSLDPTRIDRYLLSGTNLMFEGETGRRKWGFYVTAEQASRPAALAIAFDTLLDIKINDRQIVSRALLARENPTYIDAPIPPGTLQPGLNVISFMVDQRHRTDCTMVSTYDLWTEFEADGTGIVFEGADPTRLASLEELPAVGVDATGRTRIHVVAPGGERAFADSDLAQLIQAIVLRGNFRQAVVSVEESGYDGPPQGVLRLMVGTASELANVPGLPDEAERAPTVGFLDTRGGAPTLVISGPRWQDVKAAMGYVAGGVGRPLDSVRTTIDTTPMILPPVQLVNGPRKMSLAELGVSTEEFSGRRFRREFFVGLPGDFFSDAFGEATLAVDGAYTEEVRPGSRIDVYVNGFIAANTPLTSKEGDILQHLPIKVSMAHFRPGINTVAIEAVLDTEADEICAPGTVASGPNRFVLFDTSTFSIPDFARVERWPDLSALAGAGVPYSQTAGPVPVVLGRGNGETYGAAMTFVSAIAISGGKLVPVEMGRSEASSTQPAIYVGTLNQLSAATVADFGVADSARQRWDAPLRYPNSVVNIDIDPNRVVTNAFGDSSTTQGVFARWKNEVQNPSGLYGRWVEFERWLERNFDLSFNQFEIFAERDAIFDPSDRSTAIVVQAPKVADRLWTLVAGRTPQDLVSGVEAITAVNFWPQLSGRVAAYDQATGIETVPAKAERFLLSSDFSLNNIRLVAANWLSANIVIYSVALVLLCCVLGVCTTVLLRRLGRTS